MIVRNKNAFINIQPYNFKLFRHSMAQYILKELVGNFTECTMYTDDFYIKGI